jgi:hypothetical protein
MLHRDQSSDWREHLRGDLLMGDGLRKQNVKELEELDRPQYSQLLAGQNRIIFERSENETCYIHLVCHTSRDCDLEAMLRCSLLGS